MKETLNCEINEYNYFLEIKLYFYELEKENDPIKVKSCSKGHIKYKIIRSMVIFIKI